MKRYGILLAFALLGAVIALWFLFGPSATVATPPSPPPTVSDPAIRHPESRVRAPTRESIDPRVFSRVLSERYKPNAEASAQDDAEDADTTEDAFTSERSVWPVNADGIRGAMVESGPNLTACYEGWLQEDPSLAGRIELHFRIAARPGEPDVAGVVEVTVAESTTGSAVFEACVASVIAEQEFDVPDEPLDVTYPLVFDQDD